MPEMVTPEELALINEKFAKEPLLAAYCIPMMAADGSQWIDERKARLAPSSIAKFAKDAKERGPNLQLSHLGFAQPMPLGKVFDGVDEKGKLFVKAYMPPGLTIPNVLGGAVKTDDVAAAYGAGMADRVSIGFSFEKAECNLDGSDVRSPECTHSPGKKYEIEGAMVECSPLIIAGDTGMLHEVSLVWQGAIDSAKTVKRSALPSQLMADPGGFSLEKGAVPKLTECRLSMEYSLINRTIGTDAIEVTFGTPAIEPALTDAPLVTRNEARWAIVETILPESGVDNPLIAPLIDGMTEEQFTACISMIEAEQDLRGDEAVTRSMKHFEEVEALKATITTQSQEVDILKAQIATLTPLSEFGKTYLTGITNRALSSGVKLMGNEFQKDFYSAIFEAAASKGDASVIEKAAVAWETELATRFTPGRKTVEPELQPVGSGALALNGETPPQTFDRLVAEELKANKWGDEHYGDAVRTVSRKHPELVLALKA